MPKNSPRQSDFLRLFEPLQPNLERFVLGMTRDREMARDVTAETAMIAYERFESLRDEKAFLAFLFTIASRVCGRYQRHGSRRQELTREEGERRVDGVLSTDRLHDIGRLQIALEELSPKLREAVILYELLGFPMKDIGQIQGVSLSAVKVRVFRGRKWLAEILREPHHEVQPIPSGKIIGTGS